VRSSKSCNGIESSGESPTGGNFVWVCSVKNSCKEAENYLGVPLDNQLMVTIILSELQTFHKTPELCPRY
jgi:hypothetical protein